jgi:outer membrane protein assembly factor BamB/tetratricopeptide (TPR) repeat protein
MELRRVAAEAMIRVGAFARSLKELKFIGRVLESRGEVEAAARVYERVLDVAPNDPTAKQKLRKVRGKKRLSKPLRRCGSLIAAGVLLAVWFGWDVSSAIAIGNVKASGMTLPSRAAVALLREGVSRYPISGHAGRLASLEEQFYQLSFDEDKKLIRAALQAQQAGDLDTADELFGRIAAETLLSPLVVRAETGRAQIASKRARTDELITTAADLFRSGNLEEAFGVYRQILLGVHDTVLASSYSVPVFMETLPPGAQITLDGKLMGTTPRWILLPSDPTSELTLTRRGFETVSMSEVLQPMLEANDHRLSVTLEPRLLWAAERAGGSLAIGSISEPPTVAVLGADGVLRGLDPSEGKTRWEAPLGGDFPTARLESAAGPAALLSTASGRIVAFSLVSGSYAWTTRVSPKRDRVVLGPVYRGQLLVASPQRTVLLNPHTGLVARQIDVPAGRPVTKISVAGDFGLVELSGGDLVVADLRTGRREVVMERFLSEAVRTIVQGQTLLVLRTNGTLNAYSPPREEQLWETQFGAQHSVVCLNDATGVCMGSAEGTIVSVDIRDGVSLWKASVDGKLTALSGSSYEATIVAHVETNDGTVLNGFSGRSGDALWAYKAGPIGTSSAWVAKNRVLISTPSRGVVSLESLNTEP